MSAVTSRGRGLCEEGCVCMRGPPTADPVLCSVVGAACQAFCWGALQHLPISFSIKKCYLYDF